MATFILTWNPKLWSWSDDDYSHAVTTTAKGGTFQSRWSVGGRRGGIVPGDRAVLLRQNFDRGIVASGTFASEVFLDDHWADPSRLTPYGRVDWQHVVISDERLETSILKSAIPDIKWHYLLASGVKVPDDCEEVLWSLWYDHLGLGRVDWPEEEATPTGFTEGSLRRIPVNRYERDRAAREACVKHWGTACLVCGFDFGAAFGELGHGFVHVHHLVELSSIGHEYEVDPVHDLRPVCPNCHAMLHRRRPALTIDELRLLREP